MHVRSQRPRSLCSHAQGLNENVGLTPIISNYLQDDSATSAQVLVLIINSLGDNQMELYFNHEGDETGGLEVRGCSGAASPPAGPAPAGAAAPASPSSFPPPAASAHLST